VVDHHVDRPEVEAGQPAQLTGTNRSNALDAPHPAARIIIRMTASGDSVGRRQTFSRGGTAFRRDTHTTRFDQRPGIRRSPILIPVPGLLIPEPGLVAIARGKTPDPIPNSAVKTLSADGTASQGAEE
jgi:hypothetical protein